MRILKLKNLQCQWVISEIKEIMQDSYMKTTDKFRSFRAYDSGVIAPIRFHRRLLTYRHLCGFLVRTAPRF